MPLSLLDYICKVFIKFTINWLMRASLHFLFNTMALLTICLMSSCGFWKDEGDANSANQYLNHNDTVAYVGKQACRECHFQNYTSYLKTGMGLSFDTTNHEKSATVIGPDSILFDHFKNLHYQPFWDGDTMRVSEFREENGKIVHERIETVAYTVGSGDHTNSHMYRSGDYVYQIPFTFYTQKGMFDFPPGFEDSLNSRFSRKIGLECMSCHNAYPDFVLGSENKYRSIPDGIDCERCHGPGELHVNRMKQGQIVDTSQMPDYSIVNPARLSLDRQNDVCTRCHLQGTMVLKPGKSFFDFKPGMVLSDYIEVFMPLIEGGKEDFIMASHYERMSQSKCYLESKGGFSCISCHNPHISYLNTPKKKYNGFCVTCHTSKDEVCSQAGDLLQNNCVSCHMRESKSRDIHHVTIHDHKISIPPSPEQLKQKRVFKGLISVNHRQTDELTMARGYLQEFESFHPDPAYLDSAKFYLDRTLSKNEQYLFHVWINYYFMKNDYQAIINKVERMGLKQVLDSVLQTQDYSNYDAWTAYRIGQSFENESQLMVAGYFMKRACELARYNLEFQNSYGALQVKLGSLQEAEKTFQFIIAEDSRFVPARVNLGYIYRLSHRDALAKKELEKALSLDPDNKQALINLAGIYLQEGEKAALDEMIHRLEQLDPENSELARLKNFRLHE